MSVVRSPAGRATFPMRTTWAPPAGLEPDGARASSASDVASGRLVPWPSRTGARIGAAMRTDAASAARQSPPSTSVTALGRVPGESDGYTARAIAAASAIGSAPPTRVVFFVAKTGNPSAGAALLSLPLTPITGDLTAGPPDRPQPARTATAAAAAATVARVRAGDGTPPA